MVTMSHIYPGADGSTVGAKRLCGAATAMRSNNHAAASYGQSKGSMMIGPAMEMKLELVPVPVADIDRAKAFYVDQLGFNEDLDASPVDGVRVVQLTPPGSACSIVLSRGLPALGEMTPGAVRGVHLVVRDIGLARKELIGRGVAVGEIDDSSGGSVRYASVTDPDGNSMVLQEMSWRSGDDF
jgi:catechol 2,3-dioxygenase-like lactoylglutathione lyase family enzyme